MDFTELLKAGQALGTPRLLQDGGAYAVVPDGSHLADLERFLPKPARQKAAVTAHTVESFADYFTRFGTDNSAIFADQKSLRVTGVIDFHGPAGVADHCEHAITYTAPRSEEWTRWREAHGERKSQADFARWVEENRMEVRRPDAATMLETARSLKATKKVDFVSETDLNNGDAQFTYNEKTEGQTRKGNVIVPTEFIITLPIFFGEPSVDVLVRLRWRMNDAALSMWLEIDRMAYVEQEAFTDLVDTIAEKTGSKPYMGAAA